MDVTVMIPSARPAAGPMSSVYLILASLFAWGVLAAGAQAATVVIATPTATLSADSRSVRLEVVPQSPTDAVSVARLKFTWNCNLPVTFSSTNSTTRGRVVTATLPKVSSPPLAPAYRFSVLVEDPLDNAAVIGTAPEVPVYVRPTSLRVREMGTGLNFYSIFSPEAGSVNTSFSATMLDQFGDAVDAVIIDANGTFLNSTSVPDLAGVTWTLSWNYFIQEGVASNPTAVSLSQVGVFSVRNGEGVHSYALTATLTPSVLAIYSPISGTAVVQTNQVKIMFKPEQAQGVSGYLYDNGSQRTSATGTTVQWGWNIAGIDTEAMRNRMEMGGADQTERCFALMQMVTYQRVVASTDPANPTDPKAVGSLLRDPLGNQAIIESDLSVAPAPDNVLMWRLWNLPSGNYTVDIMAGDPVSYGRDVDVVLTCGPVAAPFATARLVGTTTHDHPWLDESMPFAITGGEPLVLTSGPAARRNLINRIIIKKILTVIN